MLFKGGYRGHGCFKSLKFGFSLIGTLYFSYGRAWRNISATCWLWWELALITTVRDKQPFHLSFGNISFLNNETVHWEVISSAGHTVRGCQCASGAPKGSLVRLPRGREGGCILDLFFFFLPLLIFVQPHHEKTSACISK